MVRPLRGDEIAACPHRIALSRGAPFPVTSLPESAEVRRRREGAGAWRDELSAALAAAHPGAVRPESVEDTLKHLEAGTELILSPRLPDDVDGRRRSRVQALVRVGRRGTTYTYAPLLIKNIEVIEPARTRRVLVAALDDLTPTHAHYVDGYGIRATRSVTRSALTLAHATRVLATIGVDDPQTRGAIIDRRRQVHWIDLSGQDYPRFSLERYDELYAQRLGVLEGYESWSRGEADYPTKPHWHRECLDCPFAGPCHDELESRDDVSLARFTNASQQVLLREHGVDTRAALARLDPARVRRARRSLPEDTTPEVILGRSIENLEELIYRARAHVRGGPLRIVDADAVGCPRADVEVDVDMESYAEATYLWGAYVSTRTGVDLVESGYRHFVTWDPTGPRDEAELFTRFWTWFDALRQTCRAAGKSFAAYCFWAQAEDGAMNRAVAVPVPGGPTAHDLEEFRARRPAEWIDLHAVVKSQIQTEGPLGLKSLATGVGFRWRDPNPSGEASMTWFEVARGEGPDAEAARCRLLEYNEDDCRATRALREWLDGAARDLPHRDDPAERAGGG